MLLLSLFAATACTEDTGAHAGLQDSVPVTDSALQGPAAVPTDVAAEVSPLVGTVVRVTWRVDGLGTSRVVWEGGETATVDNGVGTAEALLVGLNPETPISLRVRSVNGEDVVESETLTVTTGPLHPDLPDLTVETRDPAAEEGWVLGATRGGTSAAFILDRSGRVVWWHVGDSLYGDMVATDEGLIYLGEDPAGRSLNLVTWWGETLSSTSLPSAHHAFGLRSDGSVAFIATDKRPWQDFDLVAGDAVRHLALDGTITEIWNVWDHVEPVPSPGWSSPYYDDAEDWTHANGLDVDPSDDSALLTLTGLDALVLLDLGTGEMVEGSEAVGGSWRTAEGGEIDFPHGVYRPAPDTLLMTTSAGGETVAAEYGLVDGVWHRTWWYAPAEPVSSNAGGTVCRLAGGNTLIAWGRDNFVQEVTPDGESVWRVSFQPGLSVGRFSAVEVGPWRDATP